MSQIGTLTTGAGIQTIINLQYAPQMVYLGSVSTIQALQNFSVSIAGKETINLNGNVLINAFAQWLMEADVGNGIVGFALKVANGNIPNQQTQLRFTNNGVTTPNIFQYSDQIGTDAVFASTSSVNANANQLVTDFSALFIDTTNFQNADIQFANGFSDRFEATDIASYFTQTNQADASGLLSTALVINNLGGQVAGVRIFATGGGNCEYAVASVA